MQRMFCATGQEQTIQDEESQGLASQAEARLDGKANEDELAREQALARLRLRLRGKHQPPYVPTAPGGLRTVHAFRDLPFLLLSSHPPCHLGPPLVCAFRAGDSGTRSGQASGRGKSASGTKDWRH